MTTTAPVDLLVAAVNALIRRVGPGVYGVACSGGADSIALADAAIRAAGAAHVVVLSIDHGLVADSAAASAAVVAWARGQGAAAVARRVALGRRASREAAARTARYAALDALADELGLACVMLGHTARDQAETVMLRILRGTGPAGLAAIPAERGRFIRPLLAIDRAEIDRYVAARALPVREDPMNADLDFARVRMREAILPALRRENPQLDAALVRLSQSAAEWLAVIDAQARPFAALPIDCSRLAHAPPAIRKRAVSLALDAADIEYDAGQLERIDRLICQPDRGEVAITLRGGTAVRSYGSLMIRSSSLEPALQPDRATEITEISTISLDAHYELRTWRAGDRMRPARLRGRSRKLSDLFIDRKLPRESRRTARVLVRRSDQTIVWAEHIGAAFDEPRLVNFSPL